MNDSAIIERAFAAHAETLAATRSVVAEPLAALIGHCAEALGAGGRIFLFGNGGSAADAQHIATELTVRFERDRKALAALALTTDTSALTAIGNDLGFEHLFARQLEALGRAGDVAIGISTSGRSANVLRGLQTARDIGLVAAGLTGEGGDMQGLATPLIAVPARNTARIQEMHVLIGHVLCSALEVRFGGEGA